MTALEKIFLDNNQFTGSVPDPSRLTNLIHIHLGNNFLSNELPRAIWALSELVTLSIFNNNLLSGTIPTIIGGKYTLNLCVVSFVVFVNILFVRGNNVYMRDVMILSWIL